MGNKAVLFRNSFKFTLFASLINTDYYQTILNLNPISELEDCDKNWHIMTKELELKQLQIIPVVGKSIARDLWNIGIKEVKDLKNQDPEELYTLSNRLAGGTQDRCLLYVFRCAVYFANTEVRKQEPEKLKWWNWKDRQ